MSVKISHRQVGDVTILDLVGRVTLGEGAGSFRDNILGLLSEGKNKLLVNMSEVSYIDSSGIGELVSNFTTTTNQGGTIKLLNLQLRVRDLLQITKLYTVYEMFTDEETALRSFNGGVQYCLCPVCGQRSGPSVNGSVPWEHQDCPSCGSQFVVEMVNDSASTLSVKNARVRSYVGEWIEIVPGTPFTMRLPRRITLFSAHSWDTAWRLIPTPKRVIFDLQQATEIEDLGRDAFVTFLNKCEKDSKVAVLLEGLPSQFAQLFPTASPFYADRSAALNALGDISDTPACFTKIEGA